jgi:ATP adenylyltransferase
MILPLRHVEYYEELTEEEGMDIFKLTQISIDIMNNFFTPAGYNVGFNIGKGSGASIPHIHQHIVPRYNNEVGFLDVIGGTKIMVIDPNEVLLKLQQKFSEITI